MEKREELYRGKAKSVYKTDDANRLILLFRNDTSAFDGKRIEQLDRKGMVNNKFNAFIMQKLEAAGVPTQFDKLLGDNECLVKKLDMIPVECVVRNYAAGSLVKRLGVEEGMKLNPYTFELFLKDDAKGDPFINESHVVAFGWGTTEQLARMKELSLKVNEVLTKLRGQVGDYLLAVYDADQATDDATVVISSLPQPATEPIGARWRSPTTPPSRSPCRSGCCARSAVAGG